MLGKEFYKIEVNCELSNERLKSLVFFYGPLIGHDSLALFEYLVLRGSTTGFDELNNLLVSLNINVDLFEKQCGKLNEYRLLKTLKKEDKYILVFNNPLTIKEFIKDDILVRDFILKTSGVHYQELISDICSFGKHDDYEDISETLSLDEIKNWSSKEETYLTRPAQNKYNYNTLFDVNTFLKDMSPTLFPLKYRSDDNLKELANLADLYNISYDKMRTFIPKVAKYESNEFDLVQLRYLCMNAKTDYQIVSDSNYNVPCLQYLMSIQSGKEATEYDKKILHKLSENYHLNTSVINVLLKYTLDNCDNRLLENYMYPIASDMHRNNIKDASAALDYLDRAYNRKGNNQNKDVLPTYSTKNNVNMSDSEADELLRLMGKK